MEGAILRGERPAAVMQPTSLVNELYLKLIQQPRLPSLIMSLRAI